MKNEPNPDQLTITFLFVLSDAFRSLQTVGKHKTAISEDVISAGNADGIYISLCHHVYIYRGNSGDHYTQLEGAVATWLFSNSP